MAPSAALIRVKRYYTKIHLAPKKLMTMIRFASIILKQILK
jgi:hypothetical protein